MRKLLVITALLLFAGISFGQTLKKGGVVSLHPMEVTLNPGVSIDQYLDFWVNKLLPEAEKVFPEMTAQILKGIRTDNKTDFAGYYRYESLEAFLKYWNEDGTPTEKGAAAMAKLQPLIDEANNLGTYTQTPGDWVIITP
jgi:hypothetical protein